MEMKDKATHYGNSEMSNHILREMYERLLYKEVVLEVLVNYVGGLQSNKVQYVCNGVNWGRRVNWLKVNRCLLKRLKAYKNREDIENLINGNREY